MMVSYLLSPFNTNHTTIWYQKKDKRLRLTLNGNRKVVGTLRGFDAFLNVVLEEAQDEKATEGSGFIGQIVIRGNSIVQFETLERL